jgi:branched-chain amino acid aminotransferase
VGRRTKYPWFVLSVEETMTSEIHPIGSTGNEGSERVAPSSAPLERVRAPGLVYLDGKFFRPDEAKVSVFDHGLLYGDGVFEGIRFYEGRIFKLDQHVARMFRSAAGIRLDPGLRPEEMRSIILETVARSGMRDGYLRPLFTRGKGDLGVDPRMSPRASVIVICSTINPFAGKAETGLRMVVASLRRTPPESFHPNIKSLNYLNNVLAKAEATARGVDDALLLDLAGNVAEATGENLFAVRDGSLIVPPTTTNLEGITRATVLELAGPDLPCEERLFDLEFLRSSDEAFLTGTGSEVLPIVEVEGTPIGTGTPGPVTRRLQRDYFALVRSTGTPVPYATP